MLLLGKQINTDFMNENISFLYVILELYKMFFCMYQIHFAWKYVRSWSLGFFFLVEKYEDIIIFISLDQMKQIVWLWLIGPSWFKRNWSWDWGSIHCKSITGDDYFDEAEHEIRCLPICMLTRLIQLVAL